jgi:hypothetical protein
MGGLERVPTRMLVLHNTVAEGDGEFGEEKRRGER